MFRTAWNSGPTMVSRASPLRVGAALPDPPFEFMTDDGPAGFDVVLMQRVAARLGRTWQLVRYNGSDFNGIFAGLDSGLYDCVASGTTALRQAPPSRRNASNWQIFVSRMRFPANRSSWIESGTPRSGGPLTSRVS